MGYHEGGHYFQIKHGGKNTTNAKPNERYLWWKCSGQIKLHRIVILRCFKQWIGKFILNLSPYHCNTSQQINPSRIYEIQALALPGRTHYQISLSSNNRKGKSFNLQDLIMRNTAKNLLIMWKGCQINRDRISATQNIMTKAGSETVRVLLTKGISIKIKIWFLDINELSTSKI